MGQLDHSWLQQLRVDMVRRWAQADHTTLATAMKLFQEMYNFKLEPEESND